MYDPIQEECSCKKINPEQMKDLTLMGNELLGRLIMELMGCQAELEGNEEFKNLPENQAPGQEF